MTAVQLRRWTREEYDRMIEAGVLTTQDRVELVDGEIVTMTPQKSRQATGVSLVEMALRRAWGENALVRTQLPLALDPTSEPEPDVAVVAGLPRDYRDAHPSRAFLVVEVADASLAFDRGIKASIYARAEIADYWVQNLVDEQLELYRHPERSTDAPPGWRYTNVEHFGRGASVAPLARPDVVIALADLLS